MENFTEEILQDEIDLTEQLTDLSEKNIDDEKDFEFSESNEEDFLDNEILSRVKALERSFDENNLFEGELGDIYSSFKNQADEIATILEESGKDEISIKSVYSSLVVENLSNIVEKAEQKGYEKALNDFINTQKSAVDSLQSSAFEKKSYYNMNDKEFEEFCQRAIKGEYSLLDK